MTTEKKSGQRRLRNLLIAKNSQMRLLVPIFLLFSNALILLAALQWMLNQRINDDFVAEGALSASVLSDFMQRFIWIFAFGCTGIAALTAILGIIYSHRIFGPKVAIMRHVQALTEGDFEHRVRLRANDEFHDLARALNGLASSLQERQPR